ncbi:MAG: protein-L-isoaspartate(D-aspartate) O-methyltransferase, partial [Myxococcales bacterium]|nr:protein-L-isoaspartate(D-aspartate) O-methyltransferase [Myxococcales bacterium]
TISQPYIVARMTEALELRGTESVLEIGTGSGYQAAVLAQLAEQVFTIERIRDLAVRARRILDDLGIVNVAIRVDDGTLGWAEHAPYDRIIVTAGAPALPDRLVAQLAVGGILVIPVGDEVDQQLLRIRKTADGTRQERLDDVRFVPLIGENGWKP